MTNYALAGLMLQKIPRSEHKPRRKDIIRRFMHNSSDARPDCRESFIFVCFPSLISQPFSKCNSGHCVSYTENCVHYTVFRVAYTANFRLFQYF